MSQSPRRPGAGQKKSGVIIFSAVVTVPRYIVLGAAFRQQGTCLQCSRYGPSAPWRGKDFALHYLFLTR